MSSHNHIHGIDVAKHQGSIDWAAVAEDGNEFAYIKATEGVDYTSPTLKDQLTGARDAGLTTGLYHFARPDTNSPEAEADWFAHELARYDGATPGNLAPCLDIETEAHDLPSWVAAFLDALRNVGDRSDITVYASATWFRDKLDPDMWADDTTYLWVAHYGRAPGDPGYNTDRVVLHQYSSDGDVPGVRGRCDVNVAMGDLDTLTSDETYNEGGPGGIFSGWLFS